ncbi:hypothetical protein HCA99_10465 [Listeria booriae]|uniref:hypothetical protein n=1 Tax=Listeria booriae TaxID=1552123 RepID=UPI001628B655|nr:hypothetical protein [Listeria booriae]MBC2079634.1 hypothetical protein [Listeria booriae]
MSELVVNDDFYVDFADEITSVGNNLESYLRRYTEILESICECAIKEGDVYKNLCAFVEHANLLHGQIDTIAALLASVSKSFVEEIDVADKELY